MATNPGPSWHREQLWAQSDQPQRASPDGCGSVVWVRTGSDSFKPFILEGGP